MGAKKINNFFSTREIKLLSKMTDNYVKALEIIHRVYLDDLDKSGNIEVGHFIRVSEMLDTEDEKITGLLHDIVEDGYLTFADLIKVKFPLNIIKSVYILTRDKKKFPIYADYITRILNSNDLLAIRVKYADMLDNSSANRLNLLEENTKVRLKAKYEKQLPRLEEKLTKLDLIRKRKII